MSLLHITFATRDVQASLTFFVEALGWRPINRRLDSAPRAF